MIYWLCSDSVPGIFREQIETDLLIFLDIIFVKEFCVLFFNKNEI